MERPSQDRHWTAATIATPALSVAKAVDEWIAAKIPALCCRERRIVKEFEKIEGMSPNSLLESLSEMHGVHSRLISMNCGIRQITKLMADERIAVDAIFI